MSQAGEKIPTISQFKAMWDKNKHGAGIVVDLGDGTVHYRKGLMTFEAFKDALDEFEKMYDLKKLACGFHFRITTKGNTDEFTTHPFLLSPRYQDLRKTEYKGKLPVMMHNGTVSGFGGFLDKLSSDTQDFAATIGYSMFRKSKKGRKPSKAMRKAAENVISGSRMVVFYGDGEPVKVGPWKEAEGLCVSNTLWSVGGGYQRSTPSQSTTGYARGYTEPKADRFGMFTDTYLTEGKDWVRFSSQQEMDKRTGYLTSIKSNDGTELLQRASYANNKDAYYEVDGLEVFNEKGKALRDTKAKYTKSLTSNKKGNEAVSSKPIDYDNLDLTDKDFQSFEEPESFYDKLSELRYDPDTHQYYNKEDQKIYVDYETGEMYTEKALMFIYQENFRKARRDLEINGQMTVNWEDPKEQELRAFDQANKTYSYIFGDKGQGALALS